MKNLIQLFSKWFASTQPKDYFSHATAVVEEGAQIAANTKIWHYAHVRKGCQIGSNCILGKSVFVDSGVIIGDNVKIQNFATLYLGLTVEDGVYIGPSVTFTNDKIPRAINKDGKPKTASEWTLLKTILKKGASIGANATILPGITVGEWALIGAGSVVTKDVPAFTVVAGNPARVVGRVNEAGEVQSSQLTAAS